jgi:ElaA protein
MNTTFITKPFIQLTLDELYEIMKLRQEVFVVEQNCPYLDADGIDPLSLHCMLINKENNKLLAYTRIIPENIVYQGYSSIGRVVSSPSIRGLGLGKVLMNNTIATLKEKLGTTYPIKIGAQSYLLQFYESFGFVSTGEEYLEDGIPHTKMILEVL